MSIRRNVLKLRRLTKKVIEECNKPPYQGSFVVLPLENLIHSYDAMLRVIQQIKREGRGR